MLLVAAFLYIYYFAMKLIYELQHEQMLQGLVGVVGCAKDCSHTSCIVVRASVEATERVNGIDTNVIVDVFSRLHGGNNAAVLRAMSSSTSSRSMITPTRLF